MILMPVGKVMVLNSSCNRAQKPSKSSRGYSGTGRDGGQSFKLAAMDCIDCNNHLSDDARFCDRCGRPFWEAWAITVWADYDYWYYDWPGRLTTEGPVTSTWAETLGALKDYEVRVLLGRGIDDNQAIEVLTDIVRDLRDERNRERMRGRRRPSLPPGRSGG